MANVKRLTKELKDLNTKAIPGVEVSPKDDNIMVWHGHVEGPANSPYKGGKFHFTVTFPSDYPFKPPEVVFITKIYHPGFNEEGHICLPLLKDEWKPATSMHTVLTKVQDKLGKPSPDDPFDTDIAAILKNDEPKFTATAKEWTKKYVTVRGPENDRIIKLLSFRYAS
ncbi:hypothetical protein FRC00_007675 [Tulasnella sp. 408]|nr:hypothetical protein FRC00_007675 [Tulasnella sp. 408]